MIHEPTGENFSRNQWSELEKSLAAGRLAPRCRWTGAESVARPDAQACPWPLSGGAAAVSCSFAAAFACTARAACRARIFARICSPACRRRRRARGSRRTRRDDLRRLDGHWRHGARQLTERRAHVKCEGGRPGRPLIPEGARSCSEVAATFSFLRRALQPLVFSRLLRCASVRMRRHRGSSLPVSGCGGITTHRLGS